jgi:hypothetical protein
MRQLSGNERSKLYRRGMLAAWLGMAAGVRITGTAMAVGSLGADLGRLNASPSLAFGHALVAAIFAALGVWAIRHWAWLGLAFLILAIGQTYFTGSQYAGWLAWPLNLISGGGYMFASSNLFHAARGRG